MARTFKEGQIPPDYVGPSHHQPMAPEVTAPSAALTAASAQSVVPPNTSGATGAPSVPMTTNPQTSGGQNKLTTDMLASAMSGLTLPPNWWGYGMPPELTPGTSQITDMRGKTPMTSAPPNVPLNQSPRYTTTTTARPHTGILKIQRSRCLMHRQNQC